MIESCLIVEWVNGIISWTWSAVDREDFHDVKQIPPTWKAQESAGNNPDKRERFPNSWNFDSSVSSPLWENSFIGHTEYCTSYLRTTNVIPCDPGFCRWSWRIDDGKWNNGLNSNEQDRLDWSNLQGFFKNVGLSYIMLFLNVTAEAPIRSAEGRFELGARDGQTRSLGFASSFR